MTVTEYYYKGMLIATSKVAYRTEKSADGKHKKRVETVLTPKVSSQYVDEVLRSMPLHELIRLPTEHKDLLRVAKHYKIDPIEDYVSDEAIIIHVARSRVEGKVISPEVERIIKARGLEETIATESKRVGEEKPFRVDPQSNKDIADLCERYLEPVTVKKDNGEAIIIY